MVGRGLRFSRNDRTVEVIKLFIIWLTNYKRKEKSYSSGSRQFTSGDARVYRFIHRLKPKAKVQSVNFTSVKTHFTGKRIITASKRYFSFVVPQLDGGVFSTFAARRQRL